MKKVLSILLCALMCLSGVEALAYTNYSDVSEEYLDVVDLLNALDIMKGFDDGTFKVDETLSRAEAAAIMVRLIGLEDDVKQRETDYCDVDKNHWASGYINIATANGIVKGTGNGKFEPEGKVTYMQFVKMLDCILGFEMVAENHGGWNEGGYLYAGNLAGFTKGVECNEAEFITRMTAARLVYNALETDMLNPYCYFTGKPYFTGEKRTILKIYLKCERIDGVITDFDGNTVEVIITKNDKNNTEVNFTAGQKFAFKNETRRTFKLIGCTVMAYVKKTEAGNLFLIAAEKPVIN